MKPDDAMNPSNAPALTLSDTRPVKLNTGAQRACVHSAGLIVLLMAGALMIIMGWMPPVSPALDAQAIAQLFQEDANHIRIGAMMIMLSGAFFWSFASAISCQLKRIEGRDYSPMSDLQRSTASGTALAIIVPSLCWMVAAFRPERSPELVQLINDLGWMMFIGTIPPALVQVMAIAFCVLSDKSARPVLPRWYGFFNLWCGTGFLVGEAVAFFKTGPFAWDGFAAFWMAATFFFGWILVTWWVIARAIGEQAAEARA